MISGSDYLTSKAITHFISSALAEDIGDGDHSSLASVSSSQKANARLLIKDSGVLAGVSLAEQIFKYLDTNVEIMLNKHDGDKVNAGDEAFRVEGKARTLLSAERVVLNCMQRMSGIATYTNKLRTLISGTKAQIIDTRKTTPNFRLPEKWAVKIGGGKNHRFALYDMIMLKDNHVDLAGGISNAIARTHEYLSNTNLNLKIEIETRTLDEVKKVVNHGGVDIILLDNMPVPQLREAVTLIKGKFKTEASGGITEQNILDVAKTGVDFISVGALTHSVKSLDMSFKVII